MGKKYTTDEIEVGGHMLDASMMTSLNTVVTDSTSYMTTLPDHTHPYLPLTGGTLTGSTILKGKSYLDGTHGDARFQIRRQDTTTEGDKSYLTLWASEPGITHSSAGIGGNINSGGQYYGRQSAGAGWGAYLRFNVSSGHNEFWSTTGNPGTGGGKGSKTFYVDGSGNSYAVASSRAPVFYDSNDTGYYVNPSSTSNFNVVNSSIFSGTISTSGDGQNNTPFKLGSDYNSYMVAAAGNTWGLFWAGNNGARYGTNGLGGPGNIWGNSTNPNEFVFVGSDSTKWTVHGTTGKTWQAGTGQSATDFRAPIFYDSNNTGYYLNPASTSNLNALTVGGSTVATQAWVTSNANSSNANLLDGLNSTQFLRSDANDTFTGKLSVGNSSNRNAGIYGIYDSNKIGQIWSMGVGYHIDSSGATFNNLYGLAYKHTNNTTGGTLGGGHQMIWTTNGVPRGGIGEYYTWHDTTIKAPTGLFDNVQIAASIQHAGDTNTWFGFDMGSDIFRVVTNGTERYRVDNDGTGFYGAIGLKNTSSTSKHGIDLYGGAKPNGQPEYGMMFTGTSASGTSGDVTGDWATYFTMNGGADRGWIFKGAQGNTSSISSGGVATFNSAIKSPIFYDSNNTNYYVNPDSTSNLYDLQLTGAKHTYLYINPGNTREAMVRFNGGSGSTWYIGSRTTSDLIGSTDAHHIYSQTAARTVGGYDTAGNHFAYGSSRAPIFYDSNNTGYYLNPAGTSNLGYAHFTGFPETSGNTRASTGVSLGRFTSEYAHIDIASSHGSGGWIDFSNATGEDYRGRIRYYNSSNYMSFFAGGANEEFRVNSAYTTSLGSSRAPTFYDSDNTGYYLNPASTSNLNGLTVTATITGNISGNAVTAGNADTVDGHHASTTRNSANTIPIRDANGYLNLGWINTTSGNTNSTLSDIYVNTNDGYIRKATPAHFRSQITDGNYLPIGGKAADSNLLDGLNSTAYMRDDGWNTSPGQDADTQTGMRSDFSYGNNAPNTGELIRFGAGGYSTQFSSQYAGAGKGLNFRTRNGDAASWNPWYGIWHTGNDGSGSGLDADLLDGQHASAFAPVSHTHTWANINGETANSVNAWGGLRHQTNDGYIDFGPANSSYAHIYTDRASFYFNKKLIVNNGTIVNQNDVRAGVFYDVNNTGYYLNPASTSLLNIVKAPVYNVTAGNDNGIGFWADQTNYTIKMGNTQQDHGTVTDYSMHFNMGPSAGRGFTFGSSRTAVSASINALTGAAKFSGDVTWSGGSSANANTAYTHSQAAHAPTNAEANVQSDWNATSGDAFIQNKPAIPQGDITNVTAGNGLTGGGSTGSVTLNVVGGDGITANNDNITVDSTVVRTSGNQTIDGIKEFNTHIAMESSHLINYRFEMLEPANPQYILLCRNSGAQDVNGVIRMDRTSGNYQASSVEVIVSSGSSAMFGGTLRTLQVLQSSEDYRLISCTHNSTDWIAIKYTGNTYPETSGAFFTGRITQSSGFLTVVSSGVTNEAAFGGNSESYNEVDSFVVSGTMSASGGDSTDWNTAYTHSQATHAPTNAEANVQSDWNATSGDALILNKPTIPTDHGDHDGLYLPIGGKAADSELLDGINSTSFLRSDADDSFSGTLSGSAQRMMEPNDYGKGVYGKYSSTRFQHVWGMGASWHLNSSGTSLGNFYGIAYTHSNVGAGSQSGFAHQTLFVENGITRTWIGRGVRTVGDLMSDTSVKSPIFYDSNNTGYYLNPASTSTVNRVNYINNTIPIVVKVNSGYKSWAHHISSNDDYVLAPSTTDGSETWDWNNGFNFKATGDIMANNFLLRSDERLKTKITDLPCDNIDVAWKSFELKSDEGNYRTGVIAQELEKTNPEFVDTDDKGFKSVKYVDLLIAKIAELEARLEKLEK